MCLVRAWPTLPTTMMPRRTVKQVRGCSGWLLGERCVEVLHLSCVTPYVTLCASADMHLPCGTAQQTIRRTAVTRARRRQPLRVARRRERRERSVSAPTAAAGFAVRSLLSLLQDSR